MKGFRIVRTDVAQQLARPEQRPAGWVPTAQDAAEARQLIETVQKQDQLLLGIIAAIVAGCLAVTLSTVAEFAVNTAHLPKYVSWLPDILMNAMLLTAMVIPAIRESEIPGWKAPVWLVVMRYQAALSVLIMNSYEGWFPHNRIELSDVNPGGVILRSVIPLALFTIAEVIAQTIKTSNLAVADAKVTIREHEAELQRVRREEQEQARLARQAEEQRRQEAERAARAKAEAEEEEKRREQAEERARKRQREDDELAVKRRREEEDRQRQQQREDRQMELEAEKLLAREAAAGQEIGKAEAALKLAEADRVKAEADKLKSEREAAEALAKAEAEALAMETQAKLEADLIKAKAQAAATLKRAEAATVKAAALASSGAGEASSDLHADLHADLHDRAGESSRRVVKPSSEDAKASSEAPGDTARKAFKALLDTDRPEHLKPLGPSREEFTAAAGDPSVNLAERLREWAVRDIVWAEQCGMILKGAEIAAMYGMSAAWASNRNKDAQEKKNDRAYLEMISAQWRELAHAQ